MSDGNLKLPLIKRFDAHGNIYYITKLKTPITIDCSKGVAFLLFVSEENFEELHICPDDKEQKKTPQIYTYNRIATSEAEVIEDLEPNVRK